MEANAQRKDRYVFPNGQGVATIDGAELEAKMPTKRVAPGDSLRLDLDFRWALSDLKVRAAALERASKK
jgi:hypothetical protein